MKEIVVIPNESVAELHLGMTREQVEGIVAGLCAANGGTGNIPESESTDVEAQFATYRLWPTGIYYYVSYLDDALCHITVNGGIEGQTVATLYGIDLFSQKAQEVVAQLLPYGRCVCDRPDPLLAYTYYFPTLGILLWREMPYHPKLLQQQAYLDLSLENLQYERQFEYFGSCSLETPAYWAMCEGIGPLAPWYPVSL